MTPFLPPLVFNTSHYIFVYLNDGNKDDMMIQCRHFDIYVFDVIPKWLIFSFNQMSVFPIKWAGDDAHHESQRKHIVIAIWVIAFLQSGVGKSMGVLLPVLLDQFAAHTRNVGVVVSLIFFSGNLIGKLLLLLLLFFCVCVVFFHVYHYSCCKYQMRLAVVFSLLVMRRLYKEILF